MTLMPEKSPTKNPTKTKNWLQSHDNSFAFFAKLIFFWVFFLTIELGCYPCVPSWYTPLRRWREKAERDGESVQRRVHALWWHKNALQIPCMLSDRNRGRTRGRIESHSLMLYYINIFSHILSNQEFWIKNSNFCRKGYFSVFGENGGKTGGWRGRMVPGAGCFCFCIIRGFLYSHPSYLFSRVSITPANIKLNFEVLLSLLLLTREAAIGSCQVMAHGDKVCLWGDKRMENATQIVSRKCCLRPYRSYTAA